MLKRFCNLCDKEIKEDDDIFTLEIRMYDKEHKYNKEHEYYDDICNDCINKIKQSIKLVDL